MLGELVTSREEWLSRFMSIAEEVATWSKDPRCKVGAVVVTADRRHLSVGYNGFPRGIADLQQRLVGSEKNDLMVHAEANALDNAGFDVSGSTLFVTRCPCLPCALTVVNRRIAHVVCPPPEDDSKWGPSHRAAIDVLREAGVIWTRVEPA